MAKKKKKAKKIGRPKGSTGSHLEKMLALAHDGKNEGEIREYLKKNDQETIQKHIEEMKQNFRSELLYSSYASEFALNKDFVLGQLLTIYGRAMDAEPVLDKDGMPTGEWKCDLKTATKVVELLGREVGMFKTNVVIDDLRKKKRAEELIEQYKDVIDIKAEKGE